VRLRRVVAVTATTLAVAVTAGLISVAFTGQASAIEGGQDAGSAPFAVQVSVDGEYVCSGSIIASVWVLTAAHCLTGPPESTTVRVGDVRLGAGQEAGVVAASTRADAALLRLNRPIQTRFARLATSNPPSGAAVQTFGWGPTGFGDPPATRLQVTTRNVEKVVSGNVFVRPADDGVGLPSTRTHNGDSGGPSFFNGTQIGITHGSDEDGHVGVLVSVAAHRDWIQSTSGV
jgi:secreted trypsin-like serine protease